MLGLAVILPYLLVVGFHVQWTPVVMLAWLSVLFLSLGGVWLRWIPEQHPLWIDILADWILFSVLFTLVIAAVRALAAGVILLMLRFRAGPAQSS